MNTESQNIVLDCLETLEAFAGRVVTQEQSAREARHDLANALQACELLHFKLRGGLASGATLDGVASLEMFLRALVHATMMTDRRSADWYHAETVRVLAKLREIFSADVESDS